ncbi:MAG: methyltransferase [Myxococcaceae bacterium]|nr:methyltransferase [Myxococcaceae bacterium]
MPDWLALLVLGVIALTAASIIIGSLRLGISPMPSSAVARRAMLSLVPAEVTGEVHELGCGWGGLALALARTAPRARVIAWEASLVPYLVSSLRARGVPNLEVRHGDFLRADLSRADVLVCYLFTGGMRALSDKLVRERPGAALCVVSNTFALHGWAPRETVVVDDLWRSRVYRYDRVPSAAAPT